nr:Imm70 family immunity protein [Butyricicoccus sp. AF86-03b2A]
MGTADFLHAFFSTVCGRLENGKWGSRFPPSHERAVSRRTACQASRSWYGRAVTDQAGTCAVRAGSSDLGH